MDNDVGFRFFAVPGHLADDPSGVGTEELVEPEMPQVHEAVEKALSGAEFRDMRARDKLRSLLSEERDLPAGAAGKKNSKTAIFARPPQDLPALLRLADQLENLARAEAGERALVWTCGGCSARYAVPVALVRNVSIRCEKCDHTVDLFPERSAGEESLMDPFSGQVNVARRELAVFFREAMARGWPVLVSST